jgi:hypothetical protein
MQFKGGNPPDVTYLPEIVGLLRSMWVSIEANTSTPKTILAEADFNITYLDDHYKIWYEKGPKAFAESKYSHASSASSMEDSNVVPAMLNMMMGKLNPEARQTFVERMKGMGIPMDKL